MEVEWTEEFSYDAEKFASRHDIVCRGFHRILEDLYREGFLIKKPITGKVEYEEGRLCFKFEFGKED